MKREVSPTASMLIIGAVLAVAILAFVFYNRSRPANESPLPTPPANPTMGPDGVPQGLGGPSPPRR